MKPEQFAWARNPIGAAPLRRPGSVRRTTSIDTHWPDGFGEPMIMEGHARDVLTPLLGGAPEILADGGYTITASPLREILAIDVTPPRDNAQKMVGIRAGGASRNALSQIMGADRGTPLFQIMDDFAGASLVSGWIWSRWQTDWVSLLQKAGPQLAGRARTMEGVCTGFSPGASSLTEEGMPIHDGQSHTIVGTLIHPDDPDGWHPLAEQSGTQMRRARRIDVWRADGLIHVDAGFQDSGLMPDGQRSAVHEYVVTAIVDPAAMTLLSITADPRILPYRECPGAVRHIQKMVGHPITGFRNDVLETLPGILGCTHLNDVLRALADVPVLAASLPAG
jgi:Protein of unknown function (DUF2889)